MCKVMYVCCGLLLFGAAAGCGDDGGTEADRLGVGAECTASEGCDVVDEIELECLTEFKGGYCGLKGQRASPTITAQTTATASARRSWTAIRTARWKTRRTASGAGPSTS